MDKPVPKYLHWGMGIIAMMCIIPFLWLCFYNLPYGIHEFDWITHKAGTLPPDWWGRWMHLYTTETGRYTAFIISESTSDWFSMLAYPWFFVINILAWLTVIYFLLSAALKQMPPGILLFIAFLFTIAFFDQLNDVYDTVYRFGAMVCYWSGTILAALAACLYLKSQNQRNARWWAGILFLITVFLWVGTNEIAMLVAVCGIGMLFTYRTILFKKRSLLLFGAWLIAILGAIVVISAPGNTLRVEAEGGQILSLWKSALLTMGATAYIWIKWLSSGILILITGIMVLLPGWNYLRERSIFSDYRPWLWSLLLVVPVPMVFLIHSTGADTFPERVIDHLFFYTLLFWMGLWISLFLKWKLTQKLEPIAHSIKNTVLGISIIALSFLLFFRGLDIDRTDKGAAAYYLDLIHTDANPTNAWLTLIKGDAQTYHREMMAEFEKLKTCSTDTCWMKRPSVFPSQLYDPLSDRRHRNGDRYIGYYFNKGIKVVRFEK